ncbi:Bro-N domain-containing protein, partial [Oligella urethralis]
MKNVQIFNFETNTKIRAVLRDGEPWFVAQDVCDAIGIVNPTMALKAVDNDEKAALSLTEVSSNGVQQRREFNIINESGLYTIVLRSRKATTPGTPQHRFRKWVTSEVLPQIRKTGKYEMPSDRMTDEQV